ncbi:hypothetical protein HYV21_00910 [Candidatus Microgenomates bacterium]|nr:hypothetical protein [Candidatus Microgenomates bacterium]
MPFAINSRIALSLASIAAAGALIVGSTFAFFSSTATSTDNVFASGDLVLLLDDDDDITPAATIDASLGDADRDRFKFSRSSYSIEYHVR